VYAPNNNNHIYHQYQMYPTYLFIGLLGLRRAGGLIGGLLSLFLLLLLGAATEHGENAVRGLHGSILGSVNGLLSGLSSSLSGRFLALAGSGGGLLRLGPLRSDGGGVGLGLGDVRHGDRGVQDIRFKKRKMDEIVEFHRYKSGITGKEMAVFVDQEERR